MWAQTGWLNTSELEGIEESSKIKIKIFNKGVHSPTEISHYCKLF